jgi:DNA-binding PadR family transcriptional regulator
MKDRGWLTSSLGKSETNRDAKYYKLTKAGWRQLESETEQWGRVSAAIASLLQTG